MQRFLFSVVLSVLFVSVIASPQWGGGEGGWGEGGGGGEEAWWEGNSGDPDSFSSNSQSGSDSRSGPFNISASSFAQKNRVTISHAVLASVAWAFFFPMGAIMLRLNIKSPIMLKLHIFFQIFAYLIYVAAAGMGIWLTMFTSRYYDSWSDPHPIIGLVLLAFVTIQPITGWIHHRIYHKRAVILATTNRGPRPGRTVWGRAHLWLGRCLITLGIINGGLGLRILARSPVQSRTVTRNAAIGYGVAAGLMWCIYIFITVIWEWTRSARKRQQWYDSSRSRRRARSQSSSDSSLSREPKSPARS